MDTREVAFEMESFSTTFIFSYSSESWWQTLFWALTSTSKWPHPLRSSVRRLLLSREENDMLHSMIARRSSSNSSWQRILISAFDLQAFLCLCIFEELADVDWIFKGLQAHLHFSLPSKNVMSVYEWSWVIQPRKPSTTNNFKSNRICLSFSFYLQDVWILHHRIRSVFSSVVFEQIINDQKPVSEPYVQSTKTFNLYCSAPTVGWDVVELESTVLRESSVLFEASCSLVSLL